MHKVLFGTEAIWSNAIFLLRVWVGVIFVYHGLSIFYEKNMQGFETFLRGENIPFPAISAWLCKTSEFFGGIFLIAGFAKRLACIFIIMDMLVATFVAGNGQLLQDARTPFILLICCFVILLSKSDQLSLDRLIFKGQKN